MQAVMRHLPTYSLLFCILNVLPCSAPARAQDGRTATGHEECEERYRTLHAKIEDLLTAQATLQKRITALADELQNLREEQTRAARTAVRHDELRVLTEKLKEVDQKREDDRRLILEEIRKLAHTPPPVIEAPSRKPKETLRESKPADPPPAPEGPQKGYEYVVKDGDTLGAIVTAYQQSGVKITLDQVLKANPNIKPRTIRPGQKIFIPDPDAP